MKSAEKLAVVAMLLYSTGAVMPFLVSHQGTQVSRAEFAVQVPLYAATFLLILLHLKVFIEAAMKVKWVLALTLVAVMSTAWSQDPSFTLRRSIILMATTAFGIYFGARFDIDEQLRLLCWALAITVCGCFVFAIFLPQYGIDSSLHNGAWQGVFAQKNSLGRAAVLSIIVFGFAAPKAGRWVSWIGVTACLSLLFFSKSATSVIILAALICVVPLFNLLRAQYTFVLPILMLCAVLALLVAASGRVTEAEILHVFHRNPGLTGRTSLWSAVLAAILQRPWFGYGFEAFWLGARGPSGVIANQLHWNPPHSHNGFLDLTLEIGIFGLSVFGIGYVLLWRRALQFFRRAPGRISLWLCTYLFFLLAYNFSERTVLDQNSVFWILYSSVAVSLYLDFPTRIKSEALETAPVGRKRAFQRVSAGSAPA